MRLYLKELALLALSKRVQSNFPCSPFRHRPPRLTALPALSLPYRPPAEAEENRFR